MPREDVCAVCGDAHWEKHCARNENSDGRRVRSWTGFDAHAHLPSYWVRLIWLCGSFWTTFKGTQGIHPLGKGGLKEGNSIGRNFRGTAKFLCMAVNISSLHKSDLFIMGIVNRDCRLYAAFMRSVHVRSTRYLVQRYPFARGAPRQATIATDASARSSVHFIRWRLILADLDSPEFAKPALDVSLCSIR